jgi:RimJ/RimL family protein N-acetyltransferase
VEDAEDIYRWRTSISGQYLHQPLGYSVESQKKWIVSRTSDEMNYIIYDGDKKTGMVAIHDLNYDDLVGSVGRLILDEKYLHKRTPYGLEALLLTYDYVFNAIGFRKITGVILGLNKRVFSLQEFLGMEQEGYLKRHVILNGKEEDLYIMSLFKEGFEGYLKRINYILNDHSKTTGRT